MSSTSVTWPIPARWTWRGGTSSPTTSPSPIGHCHRAVLPGPRSQPEDTAQQPGALAAELGRADRRRAATHRPPAAGRAPAARPGRGHSAARRGAASTARRPASRPSRPGPGGGREHRVRLRGAAARTAANMAASLAVPTATSVRAVPAKLLIDNRIVINNHLARGRGGKVSFTHLIGFAVVRALAAVPEMNDAYAEVDGKPVLVQPEHVNLGLAIDMTAKDGVAPAAGAEHQGRGEHGLPPVLDGLRGRGPAGPAAAS